jgi:hypothetical protein
MAAVSDGPRLLCSRGFFRTDQPMKTAATVLLILAVYVLAAWIDNPL